MGNQGAPGQLAAREIVGIGRFQRDGVPVSQRQGYGFIGQDAALGDADPALCLRNEAGLGGHAPMTVHGRKGPGQGSGLPGGGRRRLACRGGASIPALALACGLLDRQGTLSHHQEGVAEVTQQAVLFQHAVDQGLVEDTMAVVVVVFAVVAQQQVEGVEVGVLQRCIGQHDAGDLVVRVRIQPLLLLQAGTGQHLRKRLTPEGARSTRLLVEILDAGERLAQVVFAAAVEILQAQLVLDGHHQPAPRLEVTHRGRQVGLVRIRCPGIGGGVLQHADQRHPVVLAFHVHGLKVIGNDGDIGQVGTSCGCHTGAGQAAFHGRDLRAGLTQVTGDGAGAAAQLQHAVLGSDVQRTHQTVPRPAEVVAGGPVDDVLEIAGRKGAAVVQTFHDVEQPLFGLGAFRIAEGLGTRTEVQVVICVFLVAHVSA